MCHYLYSTYDVLFECYSDVIFSEVQYGIRLVDGASENEGRLEVQINSVWGTVCDDSWDTDDADVACRQFGYSKAFIADSTTEPGDGLPILFDEVNCNGSESFLWDCANNGIAEHDCRHSEDVFLVCFPDGNSLNVNHVCFMCVCVYVILMKQWI